MPWGVELPSMNFPAASEGGSCSCRGGESELRTQALPGWGPDEALLVPEDPCPHGGTLWEELVGGRIVKEVARIFKYHLFHLTRFGLLWGNMNPQKHPFAQLPSRAHGRNHLLIPSLVARLSFVNKKGGLEEPCLKTGLHREPDSHQSHGEEAGHSTTFCFKKNKKKQHLSWGIACFFFSRGGI